MNLSVVIPSYNSQDHIGTTLSAITNQDTELDFEVIVVDCSDTDTVKTICSQFKQVIYQHELERFNPGKGRNIGASIAGGDLIIFVDSDVVLEQGSFSSAWEYYKKGNQIFGGALELNENVNPTISSYLEHYYFNHESQRLRPEGIRSNLSSALMMFDRDLFLASGGFKDIPRMQDTELTERLLKQGHSLSYTPNVVGLQIQDSPMYKVLRKVFINGKNLYFIRYQKQSCATKLFLCFFLPLLTILKVLRITCRHLKHQNSRKRCITIVLTPLLGLSALCWMIGLYRSMVFGGGISTKRD
jgi:glycosyltransferase involved in cell wall biosynthesis